MFRLCALVVCSAVCVFAASRALAGSFDYYALAISWSPTYCNSKAGHNDRKQCGMDRNYTFIVHGLWPEYQDGWPQDCDTHEEWVPDDLIGEMLPIMPSKSLIIYQWKKHGTCSNLNMSDYFALTRQLFEELKIPARYLAPTQTVITSPDEMIDDFISTNKGLERSMLSVLCGPPRQRARLAEIRICYSLDGKFRSCGDNERESCEAPTLVLPTLRHAAGSDTGARGENLGDQ